MSAHIFIDAENVKPEIGFKAVEKFSREYDIERVDIIGKEDVVSNRYLKLNEVYHFQNCFYGKNSADTWLCTEIAKTIFENPAVEVIVLVSSDRDFLPAIKLATEQNRKVIVVSNAQGHRNLKSLLWDLKVTPNLVELVDFQTIQGITIPRRANNSSATTKARIIKNNSEPKRNVPPNFADSELKEMLTFYPRLSSHNANFFRKRESQIKFIFVKRGGKLEEIPFIDGMETTNFITTLLDLKIMEKGGPVDEIIADSFLKQIDRKVYLCSEDELFDMDDEVEDFGEFADFEETAEPDEFSDFPADVRKFLNDNLESVKTIFIKHGDDLHEVPFVDGMPVNIFSRMIREMNFVNKNVKLQKVLTTNFLKIKNNGVYIADAEDILDVSLEDLKIDTDKLSTTTIDYLQANFEKIQLIKLSRAGAEYTVPFVEGMSLAIFGRILHELKVIGKSASTQPFLMSNGFTIKNQCTYRE